MPQAALSGGGAAQSSTSLRSRWKPAQRLAKSCSQKKPAFSPAADSRSTLSPALWPRRMWIPSLGVRRRQPLDDLIAEAEFGSARPAFGASSAEKMYEGVDVARRDIRIALQVILHRKIGIGVAPLAPAAGQEVIQRVDAGLGHVGT